MTVENSVLLRSITGEAERLLREKFKTKIMDDLESVVDELVSEVFKEFEPEINTYLSRSMSDMTTYLDLTVRTKHVKDNHK